MTEPLEADCPLRIVNAGTMKAAVVAAIDLVTNFLLFMLSNNAFYYFTRYIG